MKLDANNSRNFLIRWIPFVLLTTFLSGLVYITVQQVYRQNADDPQIQMSEDMANQLQNASLPQEKASSSLVDMAQSLAPFYIIFDNSVKVIASSVQLDGQTPIPPAGVFEYTKTHGQNRFTWQPKNDVREAAVITRFDGKNKGFVLAGRSLREVEKREDNLMKIVEIVWVISILGSLAVTAAETYVLPKL
jgi:hypothetical protein